MMIPNMATGLAAIALGAKGPSSAVATACAAGSNAIGDAYRLIQMGLADAMVCGGAESAITPLGVAGFASAKALSFRNDDPATASRPFDAERNGFVIGEGAGVLVLESLEHAQARGAQILAEVVGYGMTCDAHHITSPSPGGVGGAEAMRLALKDAELNASDVDYVNAHGTSTQANDSNETSAIKSSLGERAYQIPVSSTKSMTGHLLGGSGGIEAVAAAVFAEAERVRSEYVLSVEGVVRARPPGTANANLASGQHCGWKIHRAMNLDGGRSSDLWISSRVSGGPLTSRPPWNRPVRNFLILLPRE